MVNFTPQPLYHEGMALGKEWVCESVPLLSLKTELWDHNSLIKGHCTCSGKLHGLLPTFKITTSLACGRRTRSLDMAGSCEYNVVAVADSAQWVVTEIWSWEGLKNSHHEEKNLSKLRNITHGLRLRCSCEDDNEHLGSTSSEFVTVSLTGKMLSYVHVLSQFRLLSSGLRCHVVCQQVTDPLPSINRARGTGSKRSSRTAVPSDVTSQKTLVFIYITVRTLNLTDLNS
jgi:hypothetical protein